MYGQPPQQRPGAGQPYGYPPQQPYGYSQQQPGPCYPPPYGPPPGAAAQRPGPPLPPQGQPLGGMAGPYGQPQQPYGYPPQQAPGPYGQQQQPYGYAPQGQQQQQQQQQPAWVAPCRGQPLGGMAGPYGQPQQPYGYPPQQAPGPYGQQQQPYGYAPQGQQQQQQQPAWQAATSDAELRILFDSVDLDRNGVISVEELSRLSFVGRMLPERTVARVHRVFDQDSSGAIEFNEFKYMHKFVREINEAFVVADSGRTGQISVEAAVMALQRSGFSASAEAVRRTVAALQMADMKQQRPVLDFDDYLRLATHIAVVNTLFQLRNTGNADRITMDFTQLCELAAGMI
eukprot:m51a1_g2710 hypothetical protein (343) ;mRNA; r:823051-824923